MSGVLNFLKQRWLPMVCVLVVLGTLPTAWIMSSKWNEKILEEAQKDAGDKLNKIKRARVTYVIPSVVPGQPDTTLATPPNPVLTKWVADERHQRVEQVERVIAEATKLDQGPHKVLFEGLFPNPPADGVALKRKMREYLEFMLGDPRHDRPSWYTKVMREAGAGEVLDASELVSQLAEQKDREEAIAGAETENGSVPEEQREAIHDRLVSRRIGEYRRHAQEFSFYADESVLGGDSLFPPPSMEQRKGGKVPGLGEGYVWMADAWVLEDVLEAIKKANTGVGGERTEVELSPVKRIIKLEVDKLPIFGKNTEPQESATLISENGRVPVDPAASITGRVSSPGNQLYDVRRVHLELVVSSENLPRVIEAFQSTGMMTITDLDLSEVDVWEDLSKGYAYGTENVVRASMDLEIVWLRSWTVPMMPDAVRRALGVENNG